MDSSNISGADRLVQSATDADMALNDENEDSDGFSDVSTDVDDALFVDDGTPRKPNWQTVDPINSSGVPDRMYAFAGKSGYYSLQIYHDVPIFDAKDRGNANPWIRILQIKPGIFGDMIHCKLVRRPLFDGGEYYALSYSWGKGQEDREISVETARNAPVPLRVTTNLWKALQRFRHERHTVHVWADAVCVDQSWNLEREAQVNIMAQIYNQASEVRVWLGEPEIPENAAKTDAALFGSLCGQPNPWWTRLWVVQECAYARECPMVMIGDELVSFAQLIERWGSAMRQKDVMSDKLLANFQDVRMPFLVWSSQKEWNRHRLPLAHRLREVAGRQCSDPYDRIYALLNLIDETEASQLRPDYGKPFPELGMDAMGVMRASPDWDDIRDKDIEYLFDSRQWVAATFAKNRPTQDYWAALISALQEGSLEYITALMPKCTHIGVRKQDIDYALYVASKGGFVEAVRSLIEKGADVNARDPTSLNKAPNSALQAAFTGGHDMVAKILLQAGAGGKGVIKPLHETSTDSFETLVKALIEAGTSVTASGTHLSASLLNALEHNRTHVTKILIAAGARVDEKRDLNSHAQRATLARGYKDVARMIADIDSDTTAQQRFHTYALEEAVFMGDQDVVQWLIETGLVDIKSRQGYHDRPLLSATNKRFANIVKMLIQAGAAVNDITGQYSPPLLAASRICAVEIVEMLLHAGANVNGRGENEDTALQIASKGGHEQLIKMLEDAGAKL